MHELKPKGRKRTNQKAFDAIMAAGKSQCLITRREWKLATPPGAHLLRKYLKREYLVRTLADNSGWVVKRV